MLSKKPKSYTQQESKPNPVSSVQQSVSSAYFNFLYGAKKIFSEFTEKIFEPEEDTLIKEIIIQGKKYQNRRQAKQVVKQVLWFSYRKGFNIKNQYNSDVGWGCLIRVGQMALASALLKHFQSQKQMVNFISSESDRGNLIAAFSDVQEMKQKYSLNKIVDIAEKQFKHKPGQWFDISKISTSLSTLQNKHPMRGAQRMKVIFFDQSINIPIIFALQNLPLCVCPKISIVCERCHSSYRRQTKSTFVKNRLGKIQSVDFGSKFLKFNEEPIAVERRMQKQKISLQTKSVEVHSYHNHKHHQSNLLQVFRNRVFDKDLCLFVLARVGNPKIAQQVDQAIFFLLDLSFCLGIMTGFPKQAIFVVGRQDKKLIYLNPHYVQQNQTRDLSKKESYMCQQYLLCERKQLDPSMGFCFYIQNLNELQILIRTIQYIQFKFKDCLSIGSDIGYFNYDPNDYLEVDDDEATFTCLSNQSYFKP